MQQEKENALESIRNLIAYYTSDFKEGDGYTDKQLFRLTRPQAEIALRYGIPIGVRDNRFLLRNQSSGKPYRYYTILDTQMLDQQLAAPFADPMATIHTDLPRRVQQIMQEYILQIMEIECPSELPPPKPVAPLLGAEGNIYNLLCITRRTLQNAGQQERAEEMWRRVLESSNHFKAVSIMGEYVEFGEVQLPKPKVRPKADIRRPTGENHV